MRAVIADRPGGPEVLRPVELPDPEPGPGQVRVAVERAAITFIDTQLRAGTSPGPRVTFPVILGNGVGGVVDAAAADVDPAWLGARVVTTTGGSGGYASAALARAGDLHRVPAELTLDEATAVLADGRTALGLRRAAHPGAGEVVVVTAAAGGVGGLLVQLAAASGARVIGLAGDDTKLGQARALGAHHALSYRAAGWERTLAGLAPDGVDVVFDGVGSTITETLFPLVRPGGRYLPHGAAGGRWGRIDQADAAARHITILPIGAIGATGEEMFALAVEALRLTAAGTLRATIGQTFRLEAAAAAHAAIEARTAIGKTLLTTT
ncbi:alcohol dehydrogenase [Frankia sp. CcI49]|uniref:zinc-binding dehydrogenase n=1 Tax=unclassified Frankia TaxID=2632575 RepID=UPI0006CA0161|nr:MULTISPECIES: zinc-binding dehydrogenase [unclassified Frankia]KPM55047.1 alcohol dehydrogenase [Frankia sp. R43]ONH56203.1 alcohol dehydrogenase [Frankia sp. CcI49]